MKLNVKEHLKQTKDISTRLVDIIEEEFPEFFEEDIEFLIRFLETELKMLFKFKRL
ncbi:hypothetical protein [Leptotrichia trevisanii]|jgi:hypothetical protein|uniref:hypothetical protein n=1 Tax=Leptotrichia trevisanii TaxID=109328 RepID=UPI000418DF43|nr:hypothetical protein [Leptotrichia trevisanii]